MLNLNQKSTWDNLCEGEFWFEITLAITSLAYGIITAIRWHRAGNDDLAIASLVVASLVMVTLVIRAVKRNKKARRANSTHELDVVLHTLHAMLTERSVEARSASLRICVFVLAKQADSVYQLTNYVGHNGSNGAGRVYPLRAGVVGTAFRTGESQYDKLPKNISIIEYLIKKHGFDRNEASRVRQDRKSWAAIPVGEPNNVVAVIFLDSNKIDFFGNCNSIPRKMLESATIGVASYVGKE